MSYIYDFAIYMRFCRGLIMYILNFLKFSATSFRRWLRCRLLEGDTYKRQAHGLLNHWLDPHPTVADVVVVYGEVSIVEVQIVRDVVIPWVST